MNGVIILELRALSFAKPATTVMTGARIHDRELDSIELDSNVQHGKADVYDTADTMMDTEPFTQTNLFVGLRKGVSITIVSPALSPKYLLHRASPSSRLVLKIRLPHVYLRNGSRMQRKFLILNLVMRMQAIPSLDDPPTLWVLERVIYLDLGSRNAPELLN